MREKSKDALRALARVQELEASGSGIPAIGKNPLALLGLQLIQPRKLCIRHVHFAADFENCRDLFLGCEQPERNVAHGAKIVSDVVSPRAVSAGQAESEASVFVQQRCGDAIDLMLDDVRGFSPSSKR